MSDASENPYSVPVASGTRSEMPNPPSNEVKSGWRFVWAIAFATAGILVILLEIVTVPIAFTVFTGDRWIELSSFLVGATIWVIAGILWITTAVRIWDAKYRRGIHSALFSIALLATHQSIVAILRYAFF